MTRLGGPLTAALWIALASSTPASAADDPAPGAAAPAAADQGPSTFGPLPVQRGAAPSTGNPADPDAAAPAPDAAEDAAEPQSLAGTLLQTLLVLALVIALIYVTLNYGLRRLMGLRGVSFGAASVVKVVERVALDPKRSLFVVQAAGEYLLVGGADEGLSLIARLNPEEVARLLEQRKSSAAQPSPFLQKLLSRKGDVPPAGKV